LKTKAYSTFALAIEEEEDPDEAAKNEALQWINELIGEDY
jgi:CCR4-NOT transcriptional regulation complex NOT5 subunit